MDKKKRRLYISAAAFLLLTVALIITLIYSVRHRTAPPEESPSPEPTETVVTPRPSSSPRPTPTPRPSPVPAPTPEPSGSVGPSIPAITPPAITAVNPASGSDIVLMPVKPSTNSDIGVPVSGAAGGSNG